MRDRIEILSILNKLDERIAGDLETTDLEFKEWIFDNQHKLLEVIIKEAVCLSNSGGGEVIFGVRDNVLGRDKAIDGVPKGVDINNLKMQVYLSTDPKITPHFEDIEIPEGTGRIIVMHIFPGIPPYTDTSGRGTIRVGKTCQPLTGSIRQKITSSLGQADLSSNVIEGNPEGYISHSAMEILRETARKEHAPEDLLRLDDIALLSDTKLIQSNKMTLAALLLVGKESTLRKFIPNYKWTLLKLKDELSYYDRIDGLEPILIAIERLKERIMADNPLTTIRSGFFHYEYRKYPEIALREVLMNAFCHADYRVGSPVIIKQYPGKLEIGNPGDFIGGITPHNILHHIPVARNVLLVDALSTLRLVNRGNLGVPRMFFSMLSEGKEPPIIEETAGSIKVTLKGGEISIPFRIFFEHEIKKGQGLSIDHLLIFRYLLSHPEIDTPTAAHLIQRADDSQARDILHEMEVSRGYLERGGTGKGTYWSLRPEIHRVLVANGHPDRDHRIDWEAAKTRVLSVLKQRGERGELGLSNEDIRHITHHDRYQVVRLMRELIAEHPQIEPVGSKRGRKYKYRI